MEQGSRNPNTGHQEKHSLDFDAKMANFAENGTRGSSCVQEVVKKKRGRKSNKEKEEMEKRRMLAMEDGVSEQRPSRRRKKDDDFGGGFEMSDTQQQQHDRKEEVTPKVNKKKPKCGEEEPLTCHQCKRNDKGPVVRCTTCQKKRFCLVCIRAWYSFAFLFLLSMSCLPHCIASYKRPNPVTVFVLQDFERIIGIGKVLL
ncbi:lysine-specific demethylase JMJ25-like [Cajanus cajan]|uniref:lysine-specific demethylase JMJ25-like n=1 Tax=Cajanus cajan TaxID=3821 RepID=UPI0010FB683B|nr:lysine-specific demethylase JMJ25-like [Cajanus cajan]